MRHHHQFFTNLLLLLLVSGGEAAEQHLRGGQDTAAARDEHDNDQYQRRYLSETPGCEHAASMKIPLVPANMKVQLDTPNPLTKKLMDQSKNISPNWARLTFCLDRIILDFQYIMNTGTLVTDLDIECPHLTNAVHFLEPSFVLPVLGGVGGGLGGSKNKKTSKLFTSGSYPGEVVLDNADVLRILADGEACEFKVKAYNFDDGLLVGKLRGDGFQIVEQEDNLFN